MLRERQRPEEIEPLQVVADERGLHIVRGHRRGLALGMLQGIWRHRTVWAPCRLYRAEDPVVARQFADMDTELDGLGVHLHGKHSEAWHMGKPLFRTSQEWCDSVADVPAQEVSKSSEVRPTHFNKNESRRTSVAGPSAPLTSGQCPDRVDTTKNLAANGSQREAVQAISEDPPSDGTEPKFARHERNQFQQDLRDTELDVPILAGSQNLSIGDIGDSRAVCCYWLAGKVRAFGAPFRWQETLFARGLPRFAM